LGLISNNEDEEKTMPYELTEHPVKVEITRLKPTMTHKEIKENLRAALIRFGFKIVPSK
jgi:hypothetical protein